MKSTIETNREFEERTNRQAEIGDVIFRAVVLVILVGIGVCAFKLGVAVGG